MASPLLTQCRLSQVVGSLPVGALRLARMPAVVPLATSAARGGGTRALLGGGGGARKRDVSRKIHRKKSQKNSGKHVVRKQKDASTKSRDWTAEIRAAWTIGEAGALAALVRF